jgi:DNA-binding transcriptional ArsR family regulator
LGKRGNARPDDVCGAFCFDPGKVERLRPEVEKARGLGGLFAALADETRSRIAFALSRDELCVCDLATLIGISVPAASYHLRLLRGARLVKYRRDGKKVYYSLDDSHVIELMEQAVSHLVEEGGSKAR